MTFPIGTTTHKSMPALAPLRPPCTCDAMPRLPGHTTPECPACQRYYGRTHVRRQRKGGGARVQQVPSLAVLYARLTKAQVHQTKVLAALHAGQADTGDYHKAKMAVDNCQRTIRRREARIAREKEQKHV
jgi:hypothetical protein